MSDQLNVKIVVDSAQLTSGMAQASQTVQTAAERMATSMKAAGMSAADAASAMKNLGFTSAETSSSLGQVATAASATQAPVEQMARSLTNARVAGQGLLQELGIHGPRVLTSFAAQSQIIGPLLEAAFPVAAAFAFFEVLDAGYEKLLSVTAAMAGWNKEAKEMYANYLSLNQAQVNFNLQLEIEKTKIDEAGQKGSAKRRQEDIDLLKEQTLLSKAHAESAARELAIQTEMAGNPHKVTVADESGTYESEVADKPDKERLEQLNKELVEAQRNTQELANKMKTLSEVTRPTNQKSGAAAQAEEDKKQLEDWAREQDRQGREQEERARKAAEIEKTEAEAQQRFKRQTAELGAEYDKKELEDFQRSLAEKTRMTEEAGRAELSQMRANAELAEKATAEKTPHGGANSGIKQQAFAEYTQEIGLIQQLISAQKQLQDSLRSTGAAAGSESIIRSQQQELALVKEMNKAWDDYSKKVQAVMHAQQQQVSQAVNAIGAEFSRGVVSWINGQETFGRAMQRVWTQFADTVITSLLKAGVQMIANVALQKSLTDSTKLSDAGSAARSTWKSVAAIPIIGPVLAPAAAAAAFAGVMAFEEGGMVPGRGPVPAIVHGGEMILNEGQQRAMAGGGGNTFNFNHYGPGSSEQVRDSSKEMFRQAKREMRRLNR